jgi:hypothetical protein
MKVNELDELIEGYNITKREFLENTKQILDFLTCPSHGTTRCGDQPCWGCHRRCLTLSNGKKIVRNKGYTDIPKAG